MEQVARKIRQGDAIRRPRRRVNAPSASDASRLSISLIGAVSASLDGQEATLNLRKAAAIVGYLCVQERMAATRERLAYLLWSESDEQKARTSLRQTLAALRRDFAAIAFQGFRSDKLTIHIDARRDAVDLMRVLDAAEVGKVDPALLRTLRLPERILEGLEDLDDEFRSWLLPFRQSVHNRLERSLNAGLQDPSVGDGVKLDMAMALMGLDPSNEQACRFIISSYASRGDLASAMRAFERLAETLARDHGVKPSAQTQRLVDRIQSGPLGDEDQLTAPPQGSSAGAARPGGEPARREILPTQGTIVIHFDRFELHGVGDDRAYLVDGFRHELIASLVSFREWTVVEGRATASTANGRVLATEYRLQGTAYPTGSAIKLALTLLDVSRAAYVWSESFELTLSNWFAAQQGLIGRLALTLNVYLSAERLKRIHSQPDVPLTTYDSWLRAQALVATFKGDDWRKGQEFLRQAKRASPSFSPLYSASAQMGNIEGVVFPGLLITPARVERNIVEAKRAVQLDALDSRAHLCLSWAYALGRDFEAATPHMRYAMELNNNDPWTTLSAALLWAYAGDAGRARQLLAEAVGRATVLGSKEWAYYAHIRFLSGDYEGAVEAFDRAGDFPKTMTAWKAAALAHLGRLEEAVDLGARFSSAVRANWYGGQPATDEAIGRWLLQAHPLGRTDHWRRLREGLRLADIPVGEEDRRIAGSP
jgi:DNA-binding SARP family transcriptional activator/TolB-like protein